MTFSGQCELDIGEKMKEKDSMPRKGATGFTLVDLLIVLVVLIALAAFLFPFYLKKRTQSNYEDTIEHAKYLGEAELMYSNDNDEQFVPVLGPEPDARWDTLLKPYLASQPKAFIDSRLYNGGPGPKTRPEEPHFGYNYLFLSPIPSCGAQSVTRSLSLAIHPASTVMFTTSRQFGEPRSIGNIFVDAPGGFPVASPSPNVCIYTGVDNWTANWSKNNVGSERITGGVRFIDDQGGAIVVFTDGHVAAMTDTALAVGTDYATASKNNVASGATILDLTRYLWSLDGTTNDLSNPQEQLQPTTLSGTI